MILETGEKAMIRFIHFLLQAAAWLYCLHAAAADGRPVLIVPAAALTIMSYSCHYFIGRPRGRGGG